MKDLWTLPINTRAQIKTICDSLPLDYQQRLFDLGFQEGRFIECIRHTPFQGPRIFKINDNVFSIAKDLANSIQVSIHL